MHHASTRILGGLLVLAAVWIGVYWMWTPRAPRISFASTPVDDGAGGMPDHSPMNATADTQDPGPPLVSPDAGVVPPDFVQYTIQPGDSFQSIAERFFGAGAQGETVARANPLVDPRRLRAGRVILVPKDPSNIQGVPALKTPVESGSRSPQTSGAQRTYTVQKGDSLSAIAQKLLGASRHAEAIFQANRFTMASKDALKVGQVLIIPEVPAQDSQ